MRTQLGIALIGIAAFLYGIKYVAAGPFILSGVSLGSGILLLLFPWLKNQLKHDLEQIKVNWNQDLEADPKEKNPKPPWNGRSMRRPGSKCKSPVSPKRF
ncbi:hypothetical protein [Paenibacillus macerans]|uniref:hypothetical protein n=1 Tax=Paenibacillus macerans TaxID=44252 RepID=UPI003D313F55